MKKFVLKFGTSSLMKDNSLSDEIFNSVANQISRLMLAGVGVVIVSSGAIQAGREAFENLFKLERLNKKEIAGVGARHLANKWGGSLNQHQIEVCQMLITHANWSNKNERNNIKKGVLDCLSSLVVPLINENDPVSDEEIRWMEEGISENDKLAAMVAVMIEADGIFFATESNGVYTKNPKSGDAAVIKTIDCSTNFPDISGCSENGSGGIQTKIREATRAIKGGVKRAVISGTKSNAIEKFVRGENPGTEIVV